MSVQERPSDAPLSLFDGDRVNLTALAGVDPASGIEQLGHLFWYTVTELKVSRDDLEACFARAGVSVQFLPASIRAPDAFRRATSAVESKRNPSGTDGVFWNLLVREVRAGKDDVVRQVVVETVDGKNVRLDFEAIVQLQLDRKTESIVVTELRTPRAYGAQALVDKAVADAERLYDECRTHYNDRHLREVLQHVLGPGETVCVRPSGGVYFIPQRHEDILVRARALVRELEPYSTGSNRSRLYYVPVIDGSEQRDMVQESLEEQVDGELHRLTVEMADLLKSGKRVKRHVAESYVDRIRAIGKQAVTYREVLRTDLVELEAAIEAVRTQGMTLLANAE